MFYSLHINTVLFIMTFVMHQIDAQKNIQMSLTLKNVHGTNQ